MRIVSVHNRRAHGVSKRQPITFLNVGNKRVLKDDTTFWMSEHLLLCCWDKKGMDVCKKSTEHPTVPHPVFARAQAKAIYSHCVFKYKFGHPHVEFCSPLSSWPFHVLPPRRNKNTHFRHRRHENLYERGAAASLAKKTSLFCCMSRRLFSSSSAI